MTVDAHTGEIVQLSDRRTAESRANRIRASILTVADLERDLAAAWSEQDWLALGYRTWGDYTTGEFGETRLSLPVATRRAITGRLREIGMSNRQIAAGLGVSRRTVDHDAEVGNFAHLPVTGEDGKTYTPKPTPDPDLDHEMWAEQADRLTANGTVARWDAERPYLLAVVGLRNSAEEITSVDLDPAELGHNVPADGLTCLDEIAAAHAWLGAFLEASKGPNT